MDFYRIQKVLQDGCHDFRITRPNILFPFFLGLLSSVLRIYILLRAYSIFPAFLFFFRGLLINIVLILVTSFTVFFALLNTLEAWGFRYRVFLERMTLITIPPMYCGSKTNYNNVLASKWCFHVPLGKTFRINV